MSEDNLDMDLDAFVDAAAKNLMEDLLQDDDIDGTMQNIDFLVSKSEKKSELIDDIMIHLAGAEKYEHALICGKKYERLNSDAGKEIISVFAENEPANAYVFACSNNLESLSKSALEELKKANSEVLLEAYKACCEKNVGLKDFVDTLHDPALLQLWPGFRKKFIDIAWEYDESNLARQIANHFDYAFEDFISALREDDDMSIRMEKIDFLVSNAEKTNFAEIITSYLIGAREYETAMKCCEVYTLKPDDLRDNVIKKFSENDPGAAYIHGKLHDIGDLSENALEKLKEGKIEDILEAYEACCKQNMDLEDLADTLHDQMIDSDYFGEFCSLVMEYNEPRLAYWIAHNLLDSEEEADDFDEWAENTLCFAGIAGADDVAAVVEDELGKFNELDEANKSTDTLKDLVKKVRTLGEQVESHYDIKIPHLKNIRFKEPTGSYGQISYHGMMLKQAVGE